MIIYCDTSALIKLYLQEESSTLMLYQAATASLVVSCRISWAEAIAAMARRARETPKDASTIALAQQRFQTQWNHFAIVVVTQTLVEMAANYADTFAPELTIACSSRRLVSCRNHQVILYNLLVLMSVCAKQQKCLVCK